MVRIISFLNSPPSMGHGGLLGYMEAKESLKAFKQRERSPQGSPRLETMTSIEMELGAVSLNNQARFSTFEEVVSFAPALLNSERVQFVMHHVFYPMCSTEMN